MKTKILFISYDGLTDALGQSQIIPYLAELSKKGYEMHVLSTEKAENFANRRAIIQEILDKNNITWHFVNYTKKPPIVSTLFDIFKLRKKTIQLHKTHNFNIIHCRSYISAFVGLAMKRKFHTKFIFDMRGFYADERVDGNIWRIKNPIFNAVYKFFKRKEIEFLENADYTVSLTNSAKKIINSWKPFEQKNIPIEVIPCCADIDFFSQKNVNKTFIEQFKKEHKIAENDFVLSYLGSIGTWYMMDEMLAFFKRLQLKYTTAKFLFISGDNPQEIYTKTRSFGIDNNSIIVCKAERSEVPSMIRLSSASVFFIKPTFSKKASSPTKMAEILALEIPVICNSNVGDVDEIINISKAGIVVSEFSDECYDKAILEFEKFNSQDKKFLRETAIEYFDLQVGAEIYSSIYKKLI